MYEIKKNNRILARHIKYTDIKQGLNFFSADSDFIQVGVWGKYENKKILNSHIHNRFERTSNRTHEMLYIIKGSIEAMIYDLDENFAEEVEVEQGDILILLECGHGYKVTSEDTTVLEVKNGPYAGAEKDRYRFYTSEEQRT